MFDWPRILLLIFTLAATVGGQVAPDGTEAQIDFPVAMQRRNTTSMGEGCCVWTSIHHAAIWQNVPAYQEAPEWIRQHRIPGGAYPEAVAKYLPEMARERGARTTPQFLNYEGDDLDILKLACRTGRMPCVTYTFSPTGRYGGRRIAHMVNLIHADDHWFAVLDNNYIGENQIEWLTPDEFKRSFTGLGHGWAVILLAPPPPPVPRNDN